MPHLLVDISFHGFGHISQTAPVVNALAQRLPDLRVTVRSAAPYPVLRQRLQCEFVHIPAAFDFGLKMDSAVDVRVADSAAAYRSVHAHWDDTVQREAKVMRELSPDLLLADIPYLSLAAAQVAQIPAVALCSLNWADIYQHYCAGADFSSAAHAQMLAAYNSAACFLQPQPCMPMPALSNTRVISPIVQIGHPQRAALKAKLPSRPVEKLVLIAMGGMELRLPMENWPRIPGVHWLVPADWHVAREDVSAFEPLGLSFKDVLASVDAVLTKPGYGTFAEAACGGVPLLYLTRADWPETPYLVDWLQRNGACREVSRAELESGELHGALRELWGMPLPPRPNANGAEEAARHLCEMLRG